jgi:hypothetical protein
MIKKIISITSPRDVIPSHTTFVLPKSKSNKLFKKLIRDIDFAEYSYASVEHAFETLSERETSLSLSKDFWEHLLSPEIQLLNHKSDLCRFSIQVCNEIDKKIPRFDLHGLRRKSAKSFMLFILSVLSDKHEKHPASSVTFITGKGKHSKQGAVLRPTLPVLLGELGIASTQHSKLEGEFTVELNNEFQKRWSSVDLSRKIDNKTYEAPSKIKDTHWNEDKQAGLDARLRGKSYKEKNRVKEKHRK